MRIEDELVDSIVKPVSFIIVAIATVHAYESIHMSIYLHDPDLFGRFKGKEGLYRVKAILTT